MATIRGVLGEKGPLVDQFESIIAYLTFTGDKFQAALVATLLASKTKNWVNTDGVVESGPAFRSAKYLATANLEQDKESAVEMIRMAARNERVDDPYTSEIAAFRSFLAGYRVNAPNAWNNYQKAVDVFFQVIDPITYFLLDYRNGDHASKFIDAMSLYTIPGATFHGITIDTVVEGDGGLAIKQEFKIDFNAVKVTELNDAWFIIYDAAGLAHGFYYDLDGGATPPVIPGADTTDSIAVFSTDSIADVQTATDSAIGTLALYTKLSDAGLVTVWQVDIAEAVIIANEGTASTAAVATADVISPDGTNHGTAEATGTLKLCIVFQALNNDVRAPYDKGTNQDFYINSIYYTPDFPELSTTRPALNTLSRFSHVPITEGDIAYNATSGTIGYSDTVVEKTRDKNI